MRRRKTRRNNGNIENRYLERYINKYQEIKKLNQKKIARNNARKKKDKNQKWRLYIIVDI